MHKAVTPSQIRKILAAHDAGASIKNIARAVGRSTPTVYHVLAANGRSPRHRQLPRYEPASVPIISRDQQAAVNLARLQLGWDASLQEIASLSGVPLWAVCRTLGHPIPWPVTPIDTGPIAYGFEPDPADRAIFLEIVGQDV
ncbi:MAG: helix-turn-helix domain-containing protein [Planctomycetota bacterium]